MRISALGTVRLLVMLRRIWQSLEKLHKVEEERLNLEKDRMALMFPKWYQAGGRIPDTKTKASIGVVSVDDLNEKYRQQHPESFL